MISNYLQKRIRILGYFNKLSKEEEVKKSLKTIDVRMV